MLSENIKTIRKAKGLSQEELALQLNVVRQTISKWEQGLSVPDSDLLLALSEALETPVSTLLGETVTPAARENDLRAISEQLARINLQLAQRKIARRKALHWLCLSLCAGIVILFAVLPLLGSSYLDWSDADPERTVWKAILHASEYLFVRLAPLLLLGAGIGAVLTRRRG